MIQTEQINIDTDTPSSVAVLTDRRKDLLHQHGGIVTKIDFDQVFAMSIEDFVKYEVPKLTEAGATKDLIVLRDSGTEQLSLLYGDQVIQYHVTGLEECSANDLKSLFRQDEKIKRTFNLGHPLIGYVEQDVYTVLTVYLAPHKRTLKFESRAFNNCRFETQVTLPPLWFRVSLNKANCIQGLGIAAVPNASAVVDDTELFYPQLPNVYPNGSVCLGGSHLTQTGIFGNNPTQGQAVQGALQQFFTSNFNTDLVWNYRSGVAERAYDELPKLSKFEDAIEFVEGDSDVACGVRHLLQVLRVLQEPGGWMRLRWRRLEREMSASQFLGGVR